MFARTESCFGVGSKYFLGVPVRRAGLDRKIDAVAADRRRLADLYQASFIEREGLVCHSKQEIGTAEQRATRNGTASRLCLSGPGHPRSPTYLQAVAVGDAGGWQSSGRISAPPLRLIGDDNTTLGREQLDISQAQAEHMVQPSQDAVAWNWARGNAVIESPTASMDGPVPGRLAIARMQTFGQL